MSKKLIVIVGPTGVGKTELCLQIAEHLNIPIVNADSRQIFSEIPIGTAAPTPEQQQRVKHYFVGNHHLEDYYSASLFEEDVMQLLTDNLFNTSDVALMSGGSMMYIDAVCNGIDDIPTIDDNTREWMKQRLETEGLPRLVEELKLLDPEHWKIVDRNNPRRVVHALEICHMTGKTYTSFRQNAKKQRPFDIIKIGLNRDREELYNRINARVLQMFDEGLVDEALAVYDKRGLNSLNTVGYKETFEYLDGLITIDQCIFNIQSNSRRYCRKQQTWFKRDKNIMWFHPDNIKEIINYIDNQLIG
ncbi:tRNA (adenosine(37)-N6)-dimethylallyltransferase MiaA [Prevotella sp.]|jgi:tRNA dimethylallyltransferase|uniref:tRNA (adenosine(37)-N6)-dimethylallyltransferase MiaA n=1 Tax=uncultured Prevotella sp. TaxID=159272 RepID=UPI0025DDB299|nr:tRNA (adenosine(37)-N6)-dimethylallyltransferase MiaA [Prevotella sp.]MCI6129281.1 tRNA (adenosine(37)-N6)-dimethylallyltransferase MiaA [Prevotella sp.]MCI7371934.1 tRNA (adenosine(37)-N6)-dimethylallyltransferase MiaA [Prevotella sp.]MDD6198339.1 tRNA (adenosine(37)-N6)-dimethylallyltransferase MiaA [Prevotella sp.]MDY3966847.1 tRNA (adenosine(37)-N6)-dimethylallyltransferase MiaA [Prevotella sp.]MDY4644805.1 tRNA (adenosine(37)-N6)-dimethylallyltransferase MiaA [Prevotella sp.]